MNVIWLVVALQFALRDVFIRHVRSGLWCRNDTLGRIYETGEKPCEGGVLGGEAPCFASSRLAVLFGLLL